MDHQKTLTDSHVDRNAPTQAMVRGMGELGSDVLLLTELQAQLAVEDLRSATRAMVKPAVCLSLSATFLLASLPVLLIAIAELLAQYTELSRGWSYLIIAFATIFITVFSAWLSSRGMFSGLSAFNRSRDELRQNLQWLKNMWKNPRRRATTGSNSSQST